MHRQRNYRTGFSLLELILVLLIASVITLLGISQYREWQKFKQISLLKTNVALIMDSLGNYYQTHCQNQPLSKCHANRNNLKKSGFWPTNLKQTELVTTTADDHNYVTEVESIARPAVPFCGLDHNKKFHPCRIYVTAKMNFPEDISPKIISWYKETLNAHAILQETTLQWISIPAHNIQQMDTKLWILKNHLDAFNRTYAAPYSSSQQLE